jgi:hypothetical protein
MSLPSVMALSALRWRYSWGPSCLSIGRLRAVTLAGTLGRAGRRRLSRSTTKRNPGDHASTIPDGDATASRISVWCLLAAMAGWRRFG